ncbi:TetR/AcrR family transcriptional regulator C-terminal domain-containing protein [Lichenicoccus sp.]|uniref:TetR/AcrR family transcriptional regulator C-terminal domain-containing protein n=1 Tax=Lichenicoccus sp. TaxID=2781899 RepID=UPI003D1519CB
MPRLQAIGIVELITSLVCLMIDRMVTSEVEAFPELAKSFYAAGPQQAITHLADWLEIGRQFRKHCHSARGVEVLAPPG